MLVPLASNGVGRQAEVAMKLKRRGEPSKIKLFNQNLRSRKNNTA